MADFCHKHCEMLRGHPLLPSRDSACPTPCYGDFTQRVNELKPGYQFNDICEGCGGYFIAVRNTLGEIKLGCLKVSTWEEAYTALGIIDEWFEEDKTSD